MPIKRYKIHSEQLNTIKHEEKSYQMLIEKPLTGRN